MCHLILFLPVFALPVFWIFPLGTALSSYVLITGISLVIYFKIFQAMRHKVQTGQEGMLGKKAVVVEDIYPEGKIEYASEIWDAISERRRLLKGEQVMIGGFQGLRLLVVELTHESTAEKGKNRKTFVGRI